MKKMIFCIFFAVFVFLICFFILKSNTSETTDEDKIEFKITEVKELGEFSEEFEIKLDYLTHKKILIENDEITEIGFRNVFEPTAEQNIDEQIKYVINSIGLRNNSQIDSVEICVNDSFDFELDVVDQFWNWDEIKNKIRYIWVSGDPFINEFESNYWCPNFDYPVISETKTIEKPLLEESFIETSFSFNSFEGQTVEMKLNYQKTFNFKIYYSSLFEKKELIEEIKKELNNYFEKTFIFSKRFYFIQNHEYFEETL